ncbi:unnamed protein product [Callosobruchus maculatus]|uniref:C2H2-type domain-containing protein n=1 Tax=Callosobruchus maculatus TaxID=64391 RepID=A0A653CYC3_CALMS|nr:unnamed protein product [Callosobruchus maculatus]
MQNEVAVIDQIKMEVGEVKVEKIEVETESFGVEPNSWESVVEGAHDETTDRIIGLQRIKDEHNFVAAGSNIEILEKQSIKIKVEENWEDCKPFEPMYITEEDIFKLENNDDLIDGNTNIALNSGPEEKIHVESKDSSDELNCYSCNYTTSFKNLLVKHIMTEHSSDNPSLCCHCDATFESKITLDDHMIRVHPDLTSISSKIHECTYCTYKTVVKTQWTRHVSRHSKNRLRCIHCEATYKTKRNLDNHTLRNHPDASITSKVYECANCTYKTTVKIHLTKHMSKHTKTNYLRCKHCDETFKCRTGLDGHIIRKHPDFIETITSKIHECTYCEYKTTVKSRLANHMIRHTGHTDTKLRCEHCDDMFKHRTALADHMIRIHPHLMETITSKIHECEYCTFKTTVKGHLTKHMLKHNKTKLTCMYCIETFKRRIALADHITRKHPGFIGSVSHKIHKCEYCTYKTTVKGHLTRHMIKHTKSEVRCMHCHEPFKYPYLVGTTASEIRECTNCARQIVFEPPESAGNLNLSVRVHCNATYKTKKNLDDHIIKKHPESLESISSKVHECMYCTYKTTVKSHLIEHMIQHTETADMVKLRCIHCDEMFKHRTVLDEHIINKHPHLIATITNKIHECTYCAYQTVLKPNFIRHMLQHPGTVYSKKLKTCVHCNAIFKGKASLDNHTIREHPDSVASVSYKLRECGQCTYKTTLSSNFARHMRKHSKAV